MAVIQLKGARRAGLGKGGARKARALGAIPGVLYGHGETPIALSVGARDFDLALRGHKGSNPIMSLSVEGSDFRRSFATFNTIRSRTAFFTSTSSTSRSPRRSRCACPCI
jgi:ribosomal protein L25 (general stress protein Ctc)